MALADSIARAQPRLRQAVAPQWGDAIVELAEIWRMPGTTATGVPPGGAGIGNMGFPVEGGVSPTRPDQTRSPIDVQPCRIVRGGAAREVTSGGQPVTVGSWTLIFNWDFEPDIRANDKIIIAQKVLVDDEWQRVVWQPNTEYSVGDILQPTTSNGRYYRIKAITTGISAVTEPTWPLKPRGATVVNGGVTIEYVNLLRAFNVIDPGGDTTFKVTRQVACDEVLDWKGAA